MGLDMYLQRAKKKAGSFEDILKMNRNLNGKDYEKYEKEYAKFLFDRGKAFKWKSIFGEVAYWRKANAIHKWFVDNVQNENDDCNYYLVTKEDIQALNEVVNEVINTCDLIPGKICAGEHYENGKMVKDYIDGLVIEDTTKAQELLPTQEGFFFGDTSYDEFYYKDLLYTADMCEAILNFFPFDEYYLVYDSSW